VKKLSGEIGTLKDVMYQGAFLMGLKSITYQKAFHEISPNKRMLSEWFSAALQTIRKCGR
jgi:hypothetical protein